MKRFFLFFIALMLVCSVNVFGSNKCRNVLGGGTIVASLIGDDDAKKKAEEEDKKKAEEEDKKKAEDTKKKAEDANKKAEATANDWKNNYYSKISKKDKESIDAADLENIEVAIEAYTSLSKEAQDKVTDEKQKLDEFKEIAKEKDEIQNVAKKWREDHEAILEKVKTDKVAPGDKSAIDSAIKDYEKLIPAAKEMLAEDRDRLNNALDKLKTPAPEEEPVASETPLFVFIGGIVLVVLLVLLYVIVFVSKKNREKKIIEAIRECEDPDFKRKIVAVVMENQKFKEMLRSEIAKSVGNPKSYDSEIGSLQRRIADLEDSKREASQSSVSNSASSPVAPAPQQTVSKSLYAESIDGKKFNKVKETPNEDTIFELKLLSDSKATVTIYRSAYQKILANPSFLEGCNKQVLGNSSTVTVESEGRAEKDDNGKWMVTTPVNVILR